MAMRTRDIHNLANLTGMWRCPCRYCTPDIRDVYDILDERKADRDAARARDRP